MDYVLAIDQGTSSSRAVISDRNGNIQAAGSFPLGQTFPKNGWVEQDPEAIWTSSIQACRKAIDAFSGGVEDILAVGIANQRETVVVWNPETGEAYYNAIVWQDRRTADRCDRLKLDPMSHTIREITGLVIDPYFSSTKLEWLLDIDHIRDAAQRGRLCFGTVDTFLIWRLTRGKIHATDSTNASRTQLFDISKHNWSKPLLEFFDIPRSILPEIKESVDDYGQTDKKWFGKSIPILGVAGDQNASLLGQACIQHGMAKITYGTGCFALVNTGKQKVRSKSDLLTTPAYRIEGQTNYAIEGSIFTAGSSIKWLRDSLGLIASSEETEKRAIRVNGDTRGVYIVPAFTGLGAPYWRPKVRGFVSGLTFETNADHLSTAVLQSVAFQTYDLLEAMVADGILPNIVRIDGGMAANNWFCQFLTDILDIVVERPQVIETTARGAAYLALKGAAILDKFEDIAQVWSLDRRFESRMPEGDRRELVDGWKGCIEKALSFDERASSAADK